MFKNMFVTSSEFVVYPYMLSAYGYGELLSNGFGQVFFRLVSGAVSAAFSYFVMLFISYILERNGRAFLTRGEFLLGVGIYTAVANVIIGLISLLFYLHPFVYVFGNKIINFVVYTLIYFYMFVKMRARIPEYMVARAFITMAVPYFAFQVLLFI
jgi:hypothetical protein